ncbi:unnamed protein product [Arabis nemorensis]|uniref:KEN domain-containing protein n=1 Tax=Arabis nemorensis TaxID=586526 RepID=A0A565BMG3_9BRAS|nr:unnamed protein product [Arabis nemorensis]
MRFVCVVQQCSRHDGGDMNRNKSAIMENSPSGMAKFEPAFVNYLQDPEKLTPTYIFINPMQLLDLVRNTDVHYGEAHGDVKSLLDTNPLGVQRYFYERFPNPLIEVYEHVFQHHQAKPEFREILFLGAARIHIRITEGINQIIKTRECH